jgi:hypothetical protein
LVIFRYNLLSGKALRLASYMDRLGYLQKLYLHFEI